MNLLELNSLTCLPISIAFLLLFSISQAQASLLSIHKPEKGAVVPLGPLTVTGRAIQSNSTLRDCTVAVKTNNSPYVNVTATGEGKNNFSTWTFLSNQTVPGPNMVEAQLTCLKSDLTPLVKHNVHDFNVTSNANATTPKPKPSPFKQAMSESPLPPVNTSDFSRPIQNNLTNITGAFPIPPPIHKGILNNQSVSSLPPPPPPIASTATALNTTSTSDPSTQKHTSSSSITHGLSLFTGTQITGHHKIIHIHFPT